MSSDDVDQWFNSARLTHARPRLKSRVHKRSATLIVTSARISRNLFQSTERLTGLFNQTIMQLVTRHNFLYASLKKRFAGVDTVCD